MIQFDRFKLKLQFDFKVETFYKYEIKNYCWISVKTITCWIEKSYE